MFIVYPEISNKFGFFCLLLKQTKVSLLVQFANEQSVHEPGQSPGNQQAPCHPSTSLQEQPIISLRLHLLQAECESSAHVPEAHCAPSGALSWTLKQSLKLPSALVDHPTQLIFDIYLYLFI